MGAQAEQASSTEQKNPQPQQDEIQQHQPYAVAETYPGGNGHIEQSECRRDQADIDQQAPCRTLTLVQPGIIRGEPGHHTIDKSKNRICRSLDSHVS